MPGGDGDFSTGTGIFVAIVPWNAWIVSLTYGAADGEPDVSDEALKAPPRPHWRPNN